MFAKVATVLVVAMAFGVSLRDGDVYPLESLESLDAVNVELRAETYLGRKSVHMVETQQAGGESIALLADTEFENGTITVELAGRPRKDAAPNMRGFIGIAFRVQHEEDDWRYECFYLRPTNGRADQTQSHDAIRGSS